MPLSRDRTAASVGTTDRTKRLSPTWYRPCILLGVGTFETKLKKPRTEPNRNVGFFGFWFQLRFSLLRTPIYLIGFGFLSLPTEDNRTKQQAPLPLGLNNPAAPCCACAPHLSLGPPHTTHAAHHQKANKTHALARCYLSPSPNPSRVDIPIHIYLSISLSAGGHRPTPRRAKAKAAYGVPTATSER